MAALSKWLLCVVALGLDVRLISSITVPSAFRTDSPAFWGSWSAWSDCSRTCSLGVQTRTRHCLNPSGGHADPRLCAGGQDRERRVCDSGRACPVDGGWGPWGPWRCARRCGRSPGKRTRHCDNPTPRWDGRPCRGPQWDAGLCRLAPCVDDLAGGVSSNFKASALGARPALRRPTGSNATLHCADAGRLRSRFPEAALHWEHDGHPLLLDLRRQLFTGGRLELTDLRPGDAGQYACWMEAAGRPLPPVALVSLTVSAPPVTVAPGSCLTLLCRPPPPSAAKQLSAGRFEWRLNGSVRAIAHRAGRMQTLSLPDVSEADSGTWECSYTGQDQSWTLAEFVIEVKTEPSGWDAVAIGAVVFVQLATFFGCGWAWLCSCHRLADRHLSIHIDTH